MTENSKTDDQASRNGMPESNAREGVPASTEDGRSASDKTADMQEKEVGGPTGPEPTRYGDWEKKGRCIDF